MAEYIRVYQCPRIHDCIEETNGDVHPENCSYPHICILEDERTKNDCCIIEVEKDSDAFEKLIEKIHFVRR